MSKKYIYPYLISQNIAPNEAKRIGVYRSSERVMSVPLGRLAPHTGTKLYSFGLLSDTHLCPETANGTAVAERFDNALTWFEQQNAVLVAHCGDTVNVGFENPKGTYNPEQFEQYQQICYEHPNLPVYASSGNHESYNANICDYEEEYKTYTGHGIQFTVEYGNDVFIFMGMPKTTTLYVDGGSLPVPELTWLQDRLTANADKRCFVFFHPYIVGDSGDALGANENDLLPESGYVTNLIKNALINHGRAILFHGHSHCLPRLQEIDELTNFTEKNGFPSVHVSSLGWAAYIDDSGELIKDVNEGIGYLVDVYEDCIVINGWDFVKNEWTPHGVLKVSI